MTLDPTAAPTERIAKRIARAGLCSRRDAERWIAEGRVKLNGKRLETPAVTVGPDDRIEVDGKPLPEAERTRLWLYHKPKGVLVAARDPEGRPVLKDKLPKDLAAVHPIGRLDFTTEGLLLLTNDGGLKRVLELPATGWLRRYRVRAFGKLDEAMLEKIGKGLTLDGVRYGAMEVTIERQKNPLKAENIWLTASLREGKNREVKKLLEAAGLAVNRLIRVSYGPFQLGELKSGEVKEVRGRVLRDQLGAKLIEASGARFDGPDRTTDTKPEPVRSRASARPKPMRTKPARNQSARGKPRKTGR